MQRIGATGRRIILYSIIALIVVALVVTDILTKVGFVSLFERKGETVVIPNFFYFTYVRNTGSAFGFMSTVSWAQTFFKIFTAVSLIMFIGFMVYAIVKNKKLLTVALMLIIAGAIGNYIDRLFLGYVRDFIGFTFGNYNFPIFNFADICLTIGSIVFFVNFLFVDEQAIFKKNGNENTDCNE